MRAIVFPGQGSQYVGMGKELAEAFPAARAVFEEVDSVLGRFLSRTMWEGPEEELRLTVNAQPALMALSVALMKVWSSSESVQFVAGHSLGEYSALGAMGALSLSELTNTLNVRAQAMQEAVPEGKGGMVALLGVSLEQASQIVMESEAYGLCAIANDNGGGQVVISGEQKAMEHALSIARDYGAKRAVALPVSAPFHSTLMAPAAEKVSMYLETCALTDMSLPLICNVNAQPETKASSLKSCLVDQITSTVRWREIMLFLESSGVTNVIEVGAGNVLSNLFKRTVPSVKVYSLETPRDFDVIA